MERGGVPVAAPPRDSPKRLELLSDDFHEVLPRDSSRLPDATLQRHVVPRRSTEALTYPGWRIAPPPTDTGRGLGFRAAKSLRPSPASSEFEDLLERLRDEHNREVKFWRTSLENCEREVDMMHTEAMAALTTQRASQRQSANLMPPSNSSDGLRRSFNATTGTIESPTSSHTFGAVRLSTRVMAAFEGTYRVGQGMASKIGSFMVGSAQPESSSPRAAAMATAGAIAALEDKQGTSRDRVSVSSDVEGPADAKREEGEEVAVESDVESVCEEVPAAKPTPPVLALPLEADGRRRAEERGRRATGSGGRDSDESGMQSLPGWMPTVDDPLASTADSASLLAGLRASEGANSSVELQAVSATKGSISGGAEQRSSGGSGGDEVSTALSLSSSGRVALPRMPGQRKGGLKRSDLSGLTDSQTNSVTPSVRLGRAPTVMFDSEIDTDHKRRRERDSPRTFRPKWVPTTEDMRRQKSLAEVSTIASQYVAQNMYQESGRYESVAQWKAGPTLLDRCVGHPNSQMNLAFNMLRLACLLHDLVMVPLQTFSPEEGPLLLGMQLATTIFWTGDIPRQFFLGYYWKGEVITTFRRTALRYIVTWFFIDASLVAVDWGFRIREWAGSDSTEAARILRTVRIFRLVRILRVVSSTKDVESRITSEYLSVIWSLGKLFSSIVLLNHVFACFWYLIGKSERNSNRPSWVEDYLDSHPLGATMTYQYTTSFHWALTQFTPASIEVQPRNSAERIYSIFVLLFALATVSTFVSEVTRAVMELQSLSSFKTRQFWMLRRYLRDARVPIQLAVRIGNYCEHAWKSREGKVQESSVQLLTMLSTTLRGELKASIYGPKLTEHAFFMLLQNEVPVTVRTLCSTVVTRLDLLPGDVIFNQGQEGLHMYFTVKGLCVYQRHSEQHWNHDDEVVVDTRDFVSESTLWSHWSHKGTLSARTEGAMLGVESDGFQRVVNMNLEARAEALAYAKGFLQGMTRAADVDDLYQSSLVEGLWFRLLRDHAVARRRTFSRDAAMPRKTGWFFTFWRHRRRDVRPKGEKKRGDEEDEEESDQD